MPSHRPGKNRKKPWLARANYQSRDVHISWHETEAQARRAEEDWWAQPKNTSYSEWLARHIRNRQQKRFIL